MFTIHLIYVNRFIDLVGREFANNPGDLGSIPGRVISKTLKMVRNTSLLKTQQYKVRIKGKVKKLMERSSVLPAWCSSYSKRKFLVALDYGRQLYFYVLRALIDSIKENGFTFKKTTSWNYHAEKISRFSLHRWCSASRIYANLKA